MYFKTKRMARDKVVERIVQGTFWTYIAEEYYAMILELQ